MRTTCLTRYRQAAPGTSWRDDLFDKQVEFFACGERRRAAVCGRRAGKSYGDAYWLIEGGLDSPGEQSRFVALSRPHCRDILWPTMQRIARAHPELGLRLREIDNQLVAELPNGHQIKLMGARDRAEIEKFRGARYRRVVIDEAGSFGAHLEELVEDVFRPALVDLRGEIAITGSPPVLPQGYFYRVTTGDGKKPWPVYHWTMLDNPYIPHAAVELAEIRESNGWDEQHPRYRREYLGEWIQDDGSLVFPFTPERNGFRELPPGDYQHGTGMDFGVVDSTAWVVGSWVRGLPTLWLRESKSESELSPSTVAVRTQLWSERWPGRIVGDSGGIGKAFIKEMTERCGLPVVSAQKHEKRVALEFMRGDILAGTVKVDLHRCESLLDEASRVQWNEKHTDIDPRCIDHETHAALYLHRDTRLHYRPEENPPEPGSPEAGIAQMRELKAKRQAEIEKRLRRRGMRGLA